MKKSIRIFNQNGLKWYHIFMKRIDAFLPPETTRRIRLFVKSKSLQFVIIKSVLV